ncbi:hypothetical protein PVAND_009893 [Polypedilum vanderplanki]|uniref:LEM domain-containing protein n=1 Tax=Polypedilum vanderplanki TaxID=319348 RepID=A0A9J6CF03_POLVA|nr:hypothetical protein PVAND_009893 [Polypedilum vanderplanki]
MDNLELLTDDELRRRLLQYGFPNLPITQTTRKTLIKKLRNHLANSIANLRKTTNLVTRYSSGEESDSANNNKSSRASKARKTTRLTVSGSPSVSSASNAQKIPYPPLFNNYSQPLPSKTITTTNSSSSTFNRNSGNSLTSSSLPSGRNVYISPVIINDSEDDDIDWNLRRNRSSSSNSGIKLSQSRSNNNSYERGNNGYENEDDEEEDINTTSEYTKRLLQFRQEGNNMQQQKSQSTNIRKRPVNLLPQQQQYHPINENEIVYHAESYSETASVPLSLAIKNFINRLDAAYGFKQTFVPMVLVTVLFIFFALIIFMYITISPDIENALNPSITTFTICDYQHENEASFACIEEQNLVPSLNLLKVLASELQKRAISQKCGRDKTLNKLSSIMCIKDFWHYLNENQHHYHKYFQEHLSVLDVMKDVHNIEYLIDRNKQWGISNVDSSGKIQTLDEVINLRAHQAECFAILSPKLPITCTLYNKLQTFFIIIGTLSIIALISFAFLKFYYFVLHVKEKKRAQVNYIVNEIVRMLMEKTVMEKDNKNAFLVVNHLRDKIIEPGKKSELSSAWIEAITYLEQNDSRINFGFENINGEDFKVIRWIDDVQNLTGVDHNQQLQQSSPRFSSVRYNPPPFTSEARLKKWMCPAFDKSNKIKDPPTNCLKIRQMFDKYETNSPNLQAIIQDTILHKVCDKGCKIFDIQLDLKTCCTYVKCATSEDAGIVHEELNGWWLDNRLVVVKFLKQEKYNQRFPNSANACTILYPSSTSYSAIGNNYTSTNGHDFEDDIEDEDNDDFE